MRRAIATVIVCGALWGAWAGLIVVGRAVNGRIMFPLAILPVEALWIATGLVGAWLWTGASAARRIAMVMLATQIPVLVTHPLTLWWYAPGQVALNVQFADHVLLQIALEFGAAGRFWINDATAVSTFGVNFVALTGFILLWRTRPVQP
jgi:hypothetical protein